MLVNTTTTDFCLSQSILRRVCTWCWREENEKRGLGRQTVPKERLSASTESRAGRVNPRGLRVPAFAGRVELAAGRDEKFFVWVTECWVKAHELNQLTNRKTRGCTEVVCQHCALNSRPAAVITLWCNNPLLRNISSDSCHVVGKWTFSSARAVLGDE